MELHCYPSGFSMFKNFFIFSLLVFFAFSSNAAEVSTDILALKEKAEKGDAGAQLQLSLLYQTGQGVPQDLVQAYMWYSLNPDSFEKLDEITKKMTTEQIAEGRRLALERQAKTDSEDAKAFHEKSMGVLCMRNLFLEFKESMVRCSSTVSIKQNLEEAYFWGRLASSDKTIQYTSVPLHEIGKQLTQDQRLALERRIQAWRPSGQGDGKIEFETGMQYKGHDNEQAVKWFLQAAKKGNAAAQNMLAYLYAEGGGEMSDKDFIKALDGTLDRINDYIVVNNPKPITKKELEDGNKSYTLPYGCIGNDTARSMINRFKALPPEKFKKMFEDPLPPSGPPSWEPCF